MLVVDVCWDFVDFAFANMCTDMPTSVQEYQNICVGSDHIHEYTGNTPVVFTVYLLMARSTSGCDFEQQAIAATDETCTP
mmetsp:Transcript_24559/g.35212  ORF Transcript_24559/g.35212 Transcript_24559/m.35212 type:complete len:80 (-) Transcript_24559:848-1087(-)